MALVRWVQIGILVGSLLFGWLLGSKDEETAAPEPTAPKMEITVRLQDGESESLWTGVVILTDSAAVNAPSSEKARRGVGSPLLGGTAETGRDRESGRKLNERSQIQPDGWVTSLQGMSRRVKRIADVWRKDWAWLGDPGGKP